MKKSKTPTLDRREKEIKVKSAKVPQQRLPLRRIEGNLITAKGGSFWAAFVVPTIPWAFLTDKQRDSAAWKAAEAYARLQGHELHLRVTSKPYEVADWAKALNDNTQRPLGGKHPGSPFSKFLVASQKRMHKSTTNVKTVFVLVKLNGPTGIRGLLSVVPDRKEIEREAELMAEYLAGPGLEARKAEAHEIEWLLRRSHALGLPAPKTASPVTDAPWEVEDLHEITDGVHIDPTAFGQTISVSRLAITEDQTPASFKDPALEGTFRRFCERLDADPEDEMTAGEVMESANLVGDTLAEALLAEMRTRRANLHAVKTQRERFVAVLSLGRTEDVYLGDSDRPWLTVVDKLPFEVEISARVRILSGADARSSVQKSLYVIRDMQEHHAEHNEPEPLALQRQGKLAQEIEDEMTRGSGARSARAHGWYRFAVSGATEDEALQRARRIIDEYNKIRMTVVHPYGVTGGAQQDGLMREFLPCAPVASGSYLRRGPVAYFAAGMPHVAAVLGDNVGPYLGFTTGAGRRAVMFDPHHVTEVIGRSGVVPIIGEPGAGKSVLVGHIAYSAALRGERTVILDPSGPLAELCKLPELREHARHVDLTDAAPGTLSPFVVVADPQRQDYDSDIEFETAKSNAAADRKQLARDVLTMLLPPGLAKDPKVRILITEAVRRTRGNVDNSLWTVVEILESGGAKGQDEHSKPIETQETIELWQSVGAFLREAGNDPQSRLFFPSQNAAATALTMSSTLTVLTMQGITLPQSGSDPESWSHAEQMAVPLLHLASWFTTRMIYGGSNRNARKVIGLDEAHFLAAWGAGRALFNRLARDSRKWNTCVLVASQNPGDILGMKIQNLYRTAFIGQIEDEEVARDALAMVRVRGRYESKLASLTPNRKATGRRRFVMMDCYGRVDIVEIDLGHIPHVLAALNTNAREERGGFEEAVAA